MTGMTDSQFRNLAVLAVIAGAFVAYANAMTGGFVWDDASSVLLHEHVKDPSQFLQLYREDQHAFGRGQGNFYRPLLASSFMLDYQIAQAAATPEALAARIPDVSPFIFHFTSVLWHVAAALLLFALLRRLEAPRPLQLIVPLLYVVHPLHTEAVTYISGRGDSMAGAFLFAALLSSLMEGSVVRRAVGAALTGVFFIAGLLSKESAIILPFVLPLFILLRPVPPRVDTAKIYGRRAVPLGVAAAVLVGYTILRFTVLHFGNDSGGGNTEGLGGRIVQAGQAFALYIRLIFVPTGLHMERTLDAVPGWVALLGYILLLACVAVFVYGVRTGRYRVALGMGLFLVTWFPISGLIPLNAPMAEHWLYVPLAGFLWAVGELLWPYLEERKALRRVALAAVYAWAVFFIGASLDRNRDWRDDESLYRATLEQNPDSARVHYNLAVTYDEVLRNNPAGARRHYEAFLALGGSGVVPESMAEAHLSLGDLFFDAGRPFDAQMHYQQVLTMPGGDSLVPLKATAAYGLAKIMLQQGDARGAQALLQQASQGRPDLRAEIGKTAQSISLMGPS